MNNAQQLVIEMARHLEDLARQLDTLAIGKISPAVIKPSQLFELLVDIERKLPPSLRLPIDPRKDLWSYYRTTSSGSMILDEKIIIILNVPLIDPTNKMEIYRAVNLPLPNIALSTQKGKNKEQPMLAQYHLEKSVFAIDKSRMRYALLSEDQATRCVETKIGFCQFVNPLYPTHVNKFCIIALFLSNEKAIMDVCRTTVRPRGEVPVAQHVDRGLWALSLIKPLVFSLTCEKESTKTITMSPPIDTLRLNSDCTAYSSDMVLPSYEEFSSTENITPELSLNIKNQSYSLWKPFHDAIKPVDMTWNFSSLEDIEEINMDELIETLHSIKRVKVETKGFWSITNSMLTIVTVVGCIVLCIFLGRKYCQKNLGFRSILLSKISVPDESKIERDSSKPSGDGDRMLQSAKNSQHEVTHGTNFNIYPMAPLA